MCGLAGFFAPAADLNASVLRSRATAMADALLTRGPDDAGAWCSERDGVAFGFRRLAILDLSPAGHQPMDSVNGRFTIVFNGEIYNFIELRDELLLRGHEFRGHSDTEVLLGGFMEWGIEETLRRANGMFAIAVWDAAGRELTLARDRLGKKPMYYGRVGRAFIFASELKALRRFPEFDLPIDPDAVALFLRYGYVPSPRSIYKGIAKLGAGCLLRIGRDGVAHEQAYWSALEAANAARAHPFTGGEDEAISELDDLLRDSVRRRMISDVPLGAFLSGGIDSSLTVALMQAQSGQPVRTFSIGFHEPEHNEAEHAMAVARHLGTSHTELYLTPQAALDTIPMLPRIYDEPFADPSQIPTYLVSRLARQDVTVALSGDGGDELFGGYNRYFWGRRIWNALRLIPAPVRRAGSALLAKPRQEVWDRAAGILRPALPRRFREQNVGDKVAKLVPVLRASDPAMLYDDLISHWRAPLAVVKGASVHQMDWNPPRGLDFTEAMMLQDAVTYLPDDILVKVDRATMAVSLEGRAPLLDYRLFEFAWRLPLPMKIRGGQGKWILRRLLSRYVPPALIERPKMGFGVPIGEWLRGPLREWAGDLLSPDAIRRSGLLEVEPIRIAWTEHQSGRRNWQYRLWNVLVLQAWLSASRDQAPALMDDVPAGARR